MYTLSFCVYCSPIPVLSNGTCFMKLRGGGGGGGGGANKNVPPKTAPLSNEVRLKDLYNGFPTRSGKKLQLETLDVDSRLIGL